jgi:hypothetical protein
MIMNEIMIPGVCWIHSKTGTLDREFSPCLASLFGCVWLKGKPVDGMPSCVAKKVRKAKKVLWKVRGGGKK